jgi:hypothetical protein
MSQENTVLSHLESQVLTLTLNRPAKQWSQEREWLWEF